VYGNGVRPHLDRLLHSRDDDLGVGIRGKGGARRKVNYEAYVPAEGPMAIRHHPFVHDNSGGPSLGHLVDGGLHVH